MAQLVSCESKPSREEEGLFLVSQFTLPARRAMSSSLAPRPLQMLQRYYRMIRHLQVHGYFPFPWVGAFIGFLFSIT